MYIFRVDLIFMWGVLMLAVVEGDEAAFLREAEKWLWKKTDNGWLLESFNLGPKKLFWEIEPATLITRNNDIKVIHKIIFNSVKETSKGFLFSASNDLYEATKTWDFSEDTPRLTFSFKAKKELEIDLIEAPLLVYGPKNLNYSFIGGLRYSKNSSFDVVNRQFKFSYPFSTYYKIKIPARKINGYWYRSLIYCKMPIAIYSSNKYYFGIMFKPVEKSSLGREMVHSIRFDGAGLRDENYVSLSYCSHKILRKRNIWLGLPAKPADLKVKVKPNEEIYTTADLLYGTGKWYDAVDRFFMKNPLEEPSREIDPRLVAEKTRNAFWRAWDSRLKTFLQLPFKRSPGFLFDDLLFSLTSFDAERLSNFYDYHQLTGDPTFKYWINGLRSNLLSRRLIEVKRNNKIWHNGLAFNGLNAEGYTYLWTGYAGYPGGQATIVLGLLEYYNKKLVSTRVPDNRVLNNALDGLNWILETQKENGAWRCALKIFREYPARRIDYSALETVGGTAECIRALILAYKITDYKKYRISAEKGLKWLNDKKGSVIGFNYLRDAGIFEEEGISAIIAAMANIDAYLCLKDEKYLKYALTWGKYLLTWHYLWETDKLKIKYGYDPLSWSITPRIAPYETAMVLSVYSKLYRLTGDNFWRKIFIQTYNKVAEFQESDGGLSETYFLNYLKGLSDIPVQQTFAANELLRASIEYMNLENNLKFEVNQDKIEVIEKNIFLKEIIRKTGVLEIILVNKTDRDSNPIRIKSSALKNSSVFTDGKREVVSRTADEVYGIKVKAKSELKLTIQKASQLSPQLSMQGCSEYYATYDKDIKIISLQYYGDNPTLTLRNIERELVHIVIDHQELSGTDIRRDSKKTVRLTLPKGPHSVELKLSSELQTDSWLDEKAILRIPLLLYPQLKNPAGEGLIKLNARKIIEQIPIEMRKSLITLTRGKERLPFSITGKSEKLEKSNEIILKTKLDAPVIKLYLYYGSINKIKGESNVKTLVEQGELKLYLREDKGWVSPVSINLRGPPIIKVYSKDKGKHLLDISFSLWDAYSLRSRLNNYLKRALRKYNFRLLLGLGNVRDVIYGVTDRKQSRGMHIQSLEKFKIRKAIIETDGELHLNCIKVNYKVESDFHRILAKLYVLKDNGTFYVIFNPLRIKVMREDMNRTKLPLIPLFKGEPKPDKTNNIDFLELELPDNGKAEWLIYNKETTTGGVMGEVKFKPGAVGIDVALKTNWVHAGEYYQSSCLIIGDRARSENNEEHKIFLNNFSETTFTPGSVQINGEKPISEVIAENIKEKRRIKVALIYPGAKHGIYHYVNNLRKHLRNNNVVVKGFYFQEEKTAKPIEKEDIRLASKLRIGEFYFVLPDQAASIGVLEREYEKDKFDIIHLHWPSTTWDSYIFKFAEKHKIPVCVNLHYALSLRNDAYGILSRLMYNISKRYLRRADRIIVTSKSQENFVKSIGYPSVKHIPTGVDVDYFKPGKKLPSKIKTILYVGRISPEKNVEALIRAFRKCAFRDVRLVLVGKGPLLNRLKDKYIGGDVLFTGYIPEAEKLKYLQNSELFVTATRMELMSIAVLEAMSAGLPVVTSRLEAFEEFVTRDVGRMVDLDADFEDNLASAISELIMDDKMRKAMGRRAREKISRLCAWDKVGAEFRKEYEEMI